MRRGSALVELSVSLFVLVLLGAGGFQFGYAFWARDQLQAAISSGARFASRLPYTARSVECLEKTKAAARNFVVYGDPEPEAGSSPVLPGLLPANIQVDYQIDGKGVPASVTISAKDFQLEAVFSRYQMSGDPSSTMPFQGRFAPNGCGI